MEAQFCDEHLDGLAKMFKDPQPAVRSVDPVAEAGADGGNASDMVPEVYQGSQTRSRAIRISS